MSKVEDLKKNVILALEKLTKHDGVEINIEHLKIMKNLAEAALKSYKERSDDEILRNILDSFTEDDDTDYELYQLALNGLQKIFSNYLEQNKKVISLLVSWLGVEENHKNELETMLNESNDIAETMFSFYFNVLSATALSFSNRVRLTPKADRKIKGKAPKKKKDDQIKAEEWAKDIWGKDPTITQENMAYQIKDKLDLTQTIQTIKRWIKPHQPPK
ncbi:hypothetical protein JQN96_07840 [Pasteurella multocida]|uniref:hypothetical protein n=1 Tax=Pasteurella multocida TaxID=747 RepID=UPI00193C5EAB|nr:hypothetical protein [Pasteurella multocida]MBM2609118.1 hypothetical protein [Pasteurella multocida]